MLGAAETSVEQAFASPFREQTHGTCTVVLDDTEPFTTRAQPHTFQQPMDSAPSWRLALDIELNSQGLEVWLDRGGR